MPSPPDPAPTDPAALHRRQARVGLLFIAAAALILAPLAWQAAFHCDEFTVLRHVTRFASGDFARPGRPGLLWLLLTPLITLGDPVAIALGGRLVAWGASVACLVMVGTLATRTEADAGTPSVQGAWNGAAALVLLTAALSWHGHAWEIRTDSFTTPLTLLLAWRLWRNDLSVRAAIGMGLLAGALGLISQKSIYNVLAVSAGFLAFAAAQPRRALRERVRVLGTIAGVALVTVAVWYGVMTALQGPEFLASNFETAVHTGFGDDRSLGDRLAVLGGAMLDGAPLWTLAGLGALMAVAGRARHPRRFALAVAALVMLATVVVHRGVYLYYVASFEPLLAPLAASPVVWLGRELSHRLHPRASWAFALVALLGLFALSAGRHAAMQQVSNAQQLTLMRDARAAFPEPTPYWDQMAMVPGYPETTFFGTAGVRGRFRERHGGQGFIERARERRPRFFLRNYLSRDVHWRAEELRWHWRHFIPYRPNLYLLGARRLVSPEVALFPTTAEILVSGEYTVWFAGGWEGHAKIGEATVHHRQVITLVEGPLQLHARPVSGTGQLWLLLGADRVPADGASGPPVDWELFPTASRGRFQQYDEPGEPAALRTQPKDPTLCAEELTARAARHARFQEQRDETWGEPRRRDAR